LGWPNYASDASGPPDKVGSTSQCLFKLRIGTQEVSRRIRFGIDGPRPSPSPTRRGFTGGDGRGWEAHRRRGEGRRGAEKKLSRKGRQPVAVSSPGVRCNDGALLSTSAAPVVKLDGGGG
jgi:hypothetical protein